MTHSKYFSFTLLVITTILISFSSCKTLCEKNYKSFSKDVAYEYLAFENSSYWILKGKQVNMDIEVTAETQNFQPVASCQQINFPNALSFKLPEETYTIKSIASHNKDMKYTFANITQYCEGDSIIGGVVHYNTNLTEDSTQNNVNIYFMDQFAQHTDVMVYEFKSSTSSNYIKKVYIAPEIGPVRFIMNSGNEFELKDNNALLAPVEDFIED